MFNPYDWDAVLQQRRKELEDEAAVARLLRQLKSEAKQARQAADSRRPSIIERVVRLFGRGRTTMKPQSSHIAGKTQLSEYVRQI